jgi:hypothetical protein
MYHRTVYSFAQAVKFFEQDRVTLCHVYLALKGLKEHFRDHERFYGDSDPGYAMCCPAAISFIQSRHCKLSDRDLLKAAFWLTSFGCQSLSDDHVSIALTHPLDLEYHAPCPVPEPITRGPLDGMWDPLASSQNLDEAQTEEPNYWFAGEVIREDELEAVPQSFRGKDGTLQFLNGFLPILILEDLNPVGADDVSSEVRRQVEESLQFFFCNPESIAKSRKTAGDTEAQVELWNWLKLLSHGRISSQVAAKVISIISIPASEASCERSVSRQKRIMEHFRPKSRPDLPRARFLFLSRNWD